MKYNQIHMFISLILGLNLAILSQLPLNSATIVIAEPSPISEQISTSTKATSTPKVTASPKKTPKPFKKVEVPTGLSPKIETLLTQLLKCESSFNALAYNKVDRDGTPSYGALQFKPTTWHDVLKKYIDPNISFDEALAKIYDGELQVKAFLLWHGEQRPISWWQNQFPDCSKKHGYWR